MSSVVDLWAKTGSISMPDGTSIPVWGFAQSASLLAQIPGPTLEATVGDTIVVNLHNMLEEPVSVVFPGQSLVPSPVKDELGRFISYTTHAEPGSTVSYSLTLTKPGVFRYESGTRPEKQIQMGLYGVIIVRPADYEPSVRKTAYGKNTNSVFDVEQVLVMNEIDSQFHSAVANGQTHDLRDFSPDYWTLNGRSYPHSINPPDSSSQPYSSKISARVGDRILIRCINAGFQHHNIRFDNLMIRVVGIDSVPLASNNLDKTYEKNAITIASGESYDVVLTVGSPGEYVIYDRDYIHTMNISSFLGGMATLVEINNDLK